MIIETIRGLLIACLLMLVYPTVVGSTDESENTESREYKDRWQVNYSGSFCWIALEFIGFGEGEEFADLDHYTLSIGKDKHWWNQNRYAKQLGIKSTELVVMLQLFPAWMKDYAVSHVFIVHGTNRVEMIPYLMEDGHSRKYPPIYLVGSEAAESVKNSFEQEEAVYIQLIFGDSNEVKIPINVYGTRIAVDMLEACLRA